MLASLAGGRGFLSAALDACFDSALHSNWYCCERGRWGGSAPTSIVILEVIDYTFFYKKLGSAPSTKSFLISFFFLRPILALLFKSRTVLGGCNR